MCLLSFKKLSARTSIILVLSLFGLAIFTPLALAINPPTNLNVVAQPDPSRNINITWSPVPGAVKYNLYQGLSQITDKNQAEKIFRDITATSLTDSSGIPGEAYYYQVTAIDAQGSESGLSTGVINDDATVSGKEFPHSGFSGLTNLCRNCHRAHAAPLVQKILRKGPENEVCYTCHDGTGSDFNIRSTFEGQASHDTQLNGKIGSNIKCGHCHYPHGTGFTRMTVRKEEGLCFACHQASGASPADSVRYLAPNIKKVYDAFEPLNNPAGGIYYAHPTVNRVDLHNTTQ